MSKVIVIAGPTASGKTKLSLDIAKKYHLEIINGDAVQVYRCLNIGSAKITSDEQENIRHHLLDIRFPDQKYSVYDFQKDARKIINNSDVSLLVGGTGLYIKAALYDYEFSESVAYVDEEKYASVSTEDLYQKLLILDKDIIIDRNNRRRIIRALELAINSDYRSQKTKKDLLMYDTLIIYLDLAKEELSNRLTKRLDAQLAAGFIDEVRALRAQGIIVDAIGYRQINQYLDDKLSYEDMKDQIILKSRQLAKKQKTFFKNQLNIKVLSATSKTLLADACQLIDDFLGI